MIETTALEKTVIRRSKTITDPLTERRFCALWNRHAANHSRTDPKLILADLLARLAEPHRRYHGRNHVDFCLREFDQASRLMASPDAVEMALWFHDAIYAIGSGDNEEQSARLFLRGAEKSLDDGFANDVATLILATRHREPPETDSAQYTLDIDLASFGRPWPEFMADCHALRNEQTTLSHQEFYRRKCAFLHSLLRREYIYSTPWFRGRYERPARENMTRYIALIQP